MPIITLAMYSGRTQKEKDRLTEIINEDVARYWEYRRNMLEELYFKKLLTKDGILLVLESQ